MLIVEVRGDQVHRRLTNGAATDPLPVPVDQTPGAEGWADVAAALTAWADRYDLAVKANDEAALRALGAELYDWLNLGGALAPWGTDGHLALEVRADPTLRDPLADALLATPWEILCRDGFFLTQDPLHFFTVARRCGGAGEPAKPSFSDLAMLFMAAAPEGQHELDYEAEEAAILQATRAWDGQAPLAHVQVEESGALEFFTRRINRDGPFDILHLSCHGTVLPRDNPLGEEPGPILLLERPEGGGDPVRPGRLVGSLVTPPPFIFVSACRTAHRADGPPNPTREPTDPYVRQLAVQVPNVLGWDGSVYDVDATCFAQAFYDWLAQGETVPRAAARARRAVWDSRDNDPNIGRHWHLARVYLGPGGGGALCDPSQPHRPPPPDPEPAFLAKNQQIPVARRGEFVGRRRHIQRVLRAYRDGKKSVLIHGMGNLGKSSLAARVASRMPHHRTAAVFGPCHALAVFGVLQDVVQEIAAGMPLQEAQSVLNEFDQLHQGLVNDAATLERSLQRLLRGPLNTHPVLLVLDDLEQALEPPAPGQDKTVPQQAYRGALQAVLNAFQSASTASRLLLTSRFDFTLADPAGNDLAAPLARVPLTPMNEKEQTKQLWARVRTQKKEAVLGKTPGALVKEALKTAVGNPGLQEVLTRPMLNGEIDAAQAAIAAVERFHESGEVPPAGEDIGDFFRRMAFDTYTNALTPDEKAALTAATLFTVGLPVPRTALEAAATAHGVADAPRALDRLLALGLLDDWGPMAGWPSMPTTPHAAANPLAYPLADALAEDTEPSLANATLTPLANAWRDAEGDFPYDFRGVETTRLALLAGAPGPAILDAAAKAAMIFLYDLSHKAPAAVALAKPVLDALEAHAYPPGAVLLGKIIQAAERVGDAPLLDTLLKAALTRTDLAPGDRAHFLVLHANRLVRLGDIEKARQTLEEEVLPVFKALGDERAIAITKGNIANILFRQGDLTEARRIREQEELPVYEALGDRHSIAVTKGQIADILFQQGNLTEALRIREQEELPVFEALGDPRSIAITKGLIADILFRQGNLTEARRIREQEQLPVFEALGDQREIAVTKGKIADILYRQGDLTEARRIREQDQLPVYEALGDRRSIAMTKGDIADILYQQGDLTEARRIREQEELPVYEALGDRRSIAVTKGQIADILHGQGDLDGALQLHLERVPIAEAMQDIDSLAHIRYSCAGLRLARGDLERGGMQTIHDELAEAFAINKKLQRPDGIGAAGAILGQVLAMGGHPQEGIQVLEAAAAAFDKIGWAGDAALCRELIDRINNRPSGET